MEILQVLENLKTAIYEQDHQLSTAKAFMAEVEKMNPDLFHEIMEKLNLI